MLPSPFPAWTTAFDSGYYPPWATIGVTVMAASITQRAGKITGAHSPN
jgi:hypothetical protein